MGTHCGCCAGLSCGWLHGPHMDVSAGVSSSAVEKNIVIVLDVNISIVNYEVV